MTRNGVSVQLDDMPWKVLKWLSREGQTRSPMEVLRRQVWEDRHVAENTVMSTISRLRDKIRPLGLDISRSPSRLLSVP